MRDAVSALKASGATPWGLVGLGFAYGVFHAAGPGHGKAVIAAYLVSSERALLKGMALSLAAALLQAVVAIAIVSVLAALFRATRGTMDEVTRSIELTSFAAVAALGAVLLWRKAGKALAVIGMVRDPGQAVPLPACHHAHLPGPEAIERLGTVREAIGVVAAAGLRPCAGALVVLVFALSQGVFAAGIAATLAMALGTALTTGAIATLAVLAKSLALRLAGGSGAVGALAAAGLELFASAFVLVLGLSLLAGLWTGAGPS
jgi:ABC-type nickel/cobalt efflux system permease component RcnA